MKQQTLLSSYLLVLLCLFPSFLQAGIDPPPAVGSRAISLGRAYVGVYGDFWSYFHNPAAMVGIEGVEVGAYFERRFMLSELSYGYAGMLAPFGEDQAIGIGLRTAGFDAYNESEISAGYGIRVWNKISVGVQLAYNQVSIADYGKSEAVLVNVGIHTHINSQLSLGFSAYNVNQAQLNTVGFPEPIPTMITAGLAYQPTEQVLVVADVQKDIDHALSFRGGIEYLIAPVLRARVGVSTEPLTINGGIGLLWKQLQLDMAFSYTERLGYSPHISLTYQIGKKSNAS